MSVIDKPSFYIFLDVNGVLLSYWDEKRAEETPTQACKDYLKLHREFIDKDGNCSSEKYWSIRKAYYFSKSAVSNLDNLIKKVEANFKPCIVISSDWRKRRSVEELKTIYFGMHSFAKYIVDKTGEEGNRQREIQSWLNQRGQAQYFCVVDDQDEDLNKFGKHFIQTHLLKLLSEKNVEEASCLL